MGYPNTIDTIIALEWEMFQATNNQGGRASCQDDSVTFAAMRKGQFTPWTESVRRSYLVDVEGAKATGRNLVAEKYLRMMEFTAPREFMSQAHLLPPLSKKQRELADCICASMIAQTIVLRENFPLVGCAGRPLYSSEDGANGTSVETYQRGELYTYSEKTLMALRTLLEELAHQGVSLAEQVLLHSVQGYGFETLEEAETVLRQNQ